MDDIGEEPQFVVDEVSNIIKDVIEEAIGGNIYQQTKVNQWTTNVVETCLGNLTKLQKAFKYIENQVTLQKGVSVIKPLWHMRNTFCPAHKHLRVGWFKQAPSLYVPKRKDKKGRRIGKQRLNFGNNRLLVPLCRKMELVYTARVLATGIIIQTEVVQFVGKIKQCIA